MSAGEQDRERQAYLEGMTASADPNIACRARMALATLQPFMDAVNTEIEAMRDTGLTDEEVLVNAGTIIAYFGNFLADHLVVRGVWRVDAHLAVVGWVSDGMGRLHTKRLERGEGPEFRKDTGFDFRTMMREQG